MRTLDLRRLYKRELEKLKIELGLYNNEKNLWIIEEDIANSGGNQRVGRPALEEILSKIDNYKRKNIRKIIIINVFLAFITVVIGFIFSPNSLLPK